MDALKLDQDSRHLDIVEFYLNIRQKSLFSLLKAKDGRNLINKYSKIERFFPNQKIERSTLPRELFIVAKGHISLCERGQPSKRIGTVKEGRSIELATLFNKEENWKYDWYAEDTCDLLKVPFDEFLAAIRNVEGHEKYLRLVTTTRELQKFKNDLSLHGLTRDEIVKIFNELSETPFADLQNNAEAGVALISSGEILVKAPIERALTTIDTYAPGDFFSFDRTMAGLQYETDGPLNCWYIEKSSLESLLSKNSFEFLWRTGCSAHDRFLSIKKAKKNREEILREKRAKEPTVEVEEDGLEVEHFTAEAVKAKIAKKVPFYKQHDEMDCGPACLAIVSAAYKRKIKIVQFRSLVHVTRDGSTLEALRKAAKSVGLESIGIMSNLKGLKTLHMPIILLLEHHFVVLFKLNDEFATISDPAIGVRKIPIKDLEAIYSKSALLLKPTESFYKYPVASNQYKKYLQIFEGHGQEFTATIALALLLFVFGLGTPIVTQMAMDKVIAGNSEGVVAIIVVVMVGFNFLSNVMNSLQMYISSYFSTRIDLKFSVLFRRKVFSLPVSYFQVRHVGDFTTREAELGKIRSFLSNKPVTILLNLISIIAYSCIVSLYSWQVLLCIFIAIPINAALIISTSPKLMRMTQELFASSSRIQSTMIEQFRSLAIINSIGATVAARWKYEEKLTSARKVGIRIFHFSAFVGVGQTILSNLFNTSIFLISVFLFIDNELTLGQVMALSMFSGQILGPALGMIGEYHSLKQFQYSVDRVDDIITAKSEPDFDASSDHLIDGQVEFKNVTFRYGNEDSPAILKNINLKIKKGECLAFVGPSGSGKTTLGYLINLLYHPEKGKILFDDLDAKKIGIKTIRQQVAMIMQENDLFSGTITENITLGDPVPDFNRAITAAKQASAHDFIVEMKKGYSTTLGESGTGLSGGQRQRLNIARAIYKNPKVLILDEATSALDSVSEANVMNSIKDLKGKTTTIIIAHRLNTVINADRIVVLNDGEIIETGSHRELLEKRGLYCDLFRTQITS